MARPNPFEGAQEIQQMLLSYAKQETIDPLRSLGRYLGLGVAGSVLVFAGTFFVSLAVLRYSQTLEVFAGGSWGSTIPYLITLGTLLAILGLIGAALARAKRKVR